MSAPKDLPKSIAMFTYQTPGGTMASEVVMRAENEEETARAVDAHRAITATSALVVSPLAFYDRRVTIDANTSNEDRARDGSDRPLPKGLLGGDIDIVDKTGDRK